MPQDKTLVKLLGSAPRVRILRLFLSNPENSFTLSDIAKRTKINTKTARLHIKTLVDIDLLKEKKHGKKK